jgi:signal peptidase II
MKHVPGFQQKLAGLLTIALVVAIDQFSKWTITEMVMRTATGKPPVDFLSWLMTAPERLPAARFEVLPFYNIVMVWNEGVSFGLFNNMDVPMPLILSAFSLLLSFAFLLWMFQTRSPVTALSLALVTGGALGNVIDRMRFGAVIDFLDVHIGTLHWPAFNFADSCIVIGVLLLIVHSLFFEKKPSSEK